MEPDSTPPDAAGPGPNNPPAGFLRRLLALVYDSLIMIAIWAMTLFVAVPLNSGNAVVGPVINAIFFLEGFAFFAYFWCTSGQTAGMVAWRVRVESLDGNLPRLNQATMRFAGGCISLAAFGLGFLWAIVDKEKRTWHDHMAQTRLVRVPKT